MSTFENLDFPDAPRSDLERTINELVVSAQRVLATQGRLRHLLDANRSVVEELDLEQVLRRIVEAAVTLVGAQFGALGVIAPDGLLEQFIHVGIPDSDAQTIGHLPRGHGILGAVVSAAAPIRLDKLGADSRSSGFPAHHPVMDGFLGVPIRVRGEVYGNLYLTNPAAGAFSQEDEDLVTALAATAGIAIDNARLFDETRRRQRWSAATAAVTSALLAEPAVDVLELIVEHVASAVDADRVYVVTDDSALEHGPTLLLSFSATGLPIGLITIAREVGAPAYGAAETEMATEFAAQASLAIELARARVDSVQLELVQDRNRIARDLHDHVIQRLFASGLTLQSMVGRVPSDLRGELGDQVDAIDSAIAQIRTAVFTLGSRSIAGPPGLRSRILEVVSELTPHLAATPRLTFGGPVDLMIDGDFAADVIAVVREGLSNIARHAAAVDSSIDVSVSGATVVVRIEDDGVGVPQGTSRSSGTANLADRAARYGGTFALDPRAPRGTLLIWTAPITGDP
ncbi:GAF domain-containing protein [Glaciihabitans arcticus]|uniref:GAF domain-containing sensor histidine kinase n=1 Tax=Glaciihabitans arcticus TaxID=2668039 RepID=UPI0013867C2F|nr:GAF domain-containing protein [Glaciihabitans arcticus]